MAGSTQGTPLVSIIVPAHNYGRFVGEALESVQAQTHAHWECVVVDDGSKDDTGTVVRAYAASDRRIKYLWQDNAGPSAARNKGLESAAGDFIAFLDADDLIEPGKLAFQVAALESNPATAIVYGEARYFSTESPLTRLRSIDGDDPWIAPISGTGSELLRTLLYNNITTVNSPMLRRTVVQQVGRFDDMVPGVEDYDYWIRCAVQGLRFQYADAEQTRALVRSHAVSLSRDRRRATRSLLVMHRKCARTIVDPDLVVVNRGRIAELEGQLGLEEVAAGNLYAGLAQFLKAAWLERRGRHRAKWLAIAGAAPFQQPARLKAMATTSLRAWFARPSSRGRRTT